VVAGQRARQIQGGASSKLEIGVNKPAYIALKEAEANLIRWEILLDEDATPDEEGSE
jgi:DNA-directed RNA polymerase subunit K/omega